MKFVIGVVIVIILYLGAKNLIGRWQAVQSQQEPGLSQTVEPQAAATPTPAELPGLPPHLEGSLEAAKRQGAGALKVWLKKNRSAVRDPRLAEIELDYVILVAGRDFGEARQVFAAVKSRTPTDSPVYLRIKNLAPSYE
jgi:hypothetical protein